MLSLGHLGGDAWTGAGRREQVQEMGWDSLGGGLDSVPAGVWLRAPPPAPSALPSQVDVPPFTWSGTGDSARLTGPCSPCGPLSEEGQSGTV